MNVKSIKIDNNATVGPAPLLVDVAPALKWVDGKATEVVEGYRYTIACPGARMETLAVKVLGPQAVTLTPGTLLPVNLEGLELYIYVRDGRAMVGARATAIRPAKNN